MGDVLSQYRMLVDALRETRRHCAWKVVDDRPILTLLEELFWCLSDEEQDLVNAEGWRGWPDLYDQRMFVEEYSTTDLDDDTYLELPPRRFEAMAA